LLELGKDAPLIVVGTRHLGSVKGLFLGSVSTNVAAHAHGRVAIVAGDGIDDGPEGAAVPGTPASDAAVPEASRQASLRNARLTAVHPWSPLDAGALHGYGIRREEVERMTADPVEVLAARLAGYPQDSPDVRVERRLL